jgi:hypothetical protein
MVSEITLNEQLIAETIHALAQAAYSVEAKQIGCTDFPPLRETVEQLRVSADRFLVFRESGNTVAVLSFACDAGPSHALRSVPYIFENGLRKLCSQNWRNAFRRLRHFPCPLPKLIFLQ